MDKETETTRFSGWRLRVSARSGLGLRAGNDEMERNMQVLYY